MVVVGYEDDGRYIGVLHGVLEELGISGSWVASPELLGSRISSIADGVIVVLDCGLLAAYEPNRLFQIVEDLRTLGNVRHIILSSGLVTEDECHRAGVLSAQASFANKATVDWYELIAGISAEGGVPVASTPTYSALTAEWRAIGMVEAAGDGPRLEMAFRALVLADGTYDLLPDVHTEAAQIDLVLVPRLPSHDLPQREFVLVECRNRRSKVSAPQVRVLASVMEDIGAKVGVIVSRAPLTGSRTTAAQGVVLGQWRKHERVIVRFSLGDCFSIVSGQTTLYRMLREKCRVVALTAAQA